MRWEPIRSHRGLATSGVLEQATGRIFGIEGWPVVQALGGETWLHGGLSGTQRTGGLTEAQLTDELGPDFLQLPIPRNASATISWWQVRQAAFNRALQVSPLIPSRAAAACCAGIRHLAYAQATCRGSENSA